MVLREAGETQKCLSQQHWDGTLYVAIGIPKAGITSTKISKWDGSKWSELGPEIKGDVYYLATGPKGTLYAVGHSYSGTTKSSIQCVTKWNGSEWSNVKIPEDAQKALQNIALAVGPDGTLYAAFTTAKHCFVAKWNGSN